jgi:hypothetical protein
MRGIAAAVLAMLVAAGCESAPSKNESPGSPSSASEAASASPSAGGSAAGGSAPAAEAPAQGGGIGLAQDAPAAAIVRYRRIVVAAVTVGGHDTEFDGISDEDKQRLAIELGEKFRSTLAQHFSIADRPGPGVARLQLTLEGIKTSNSVLSTGLRVLPLGMAMSLVRGARDKPARFTGFVTLSGRFSDSVSGTPLAHFAGSVYPRAYDLGSGLGSLKAAELGMQRAADEITAQLQALGNPGP